MFSLTPALKIVSQCWKLDRKDGELASLALSNLKIESHNYKCYCLFGTRLYFPSILTGESLVNITTDK
jgi:hypothetical protein